jgi:hypothetical protein
MLKIYKDVEHLIHRADMAVLSVEDYRALGVAILRGAIASPVIGAWQASWESFRSKQIPSYRTVNPFNPVVLNETVTQELATIYRHPELLDIMEQIYPDLGIFEQRFLIKDKQSRTPTFFHQDYGYDLGWPEKTSVFLPLTPMTPENGGLVFLPGTHHAGYLGDVGEINVDAIAPNWPVLRPSLKPGDIILMHECTWHGSGAHVSGPDRIMVQMQYQPASDPSNFELLRGKDDSVLKLTDSVRHLIFLRSRTTRLKELQAEVERRAAIEKPK